MSTRDICGLASYFVAIISPPVQRFFFVLCPGPCRWLITSYLLKWMLSQDRQIIVSHDEMTHDICTFGRMRRINLAKLWGIISV